MPSGAPGPPSAPLCNPPPPPSAAPAPLLPRLAFGQGRTSSAGDGSGVAAAAAAAPASPPSQPSPAAAYPATVASWSLLQLPQPIAAPASPRRWPCPCPCSCTSGGTAKIMPVPEGAPGPGHCCFCWLSTRSPCWYHRSAASLHSAPVTPCGSESSRGSPASALPACKPTPSVPISPPASPTAPPIQHTPPGATVAPGCALAASPSQASGATKPSAVLHRRRHVASLSSRVTAAAAAVPAAV